MRSQNSNLKCRQSFLAKILKSSAQSMKFLIILHAVLGLRTRAIKVRRDKLTHS